MIRIAFDPDENENDDERAAPIPIINDPVNEAGEQVFVVQLRLIDSTNPGAISLNIRAASICRIINDDSKSNCDELVVFIYNFISRHATAIRIGFEVPRYTYIEPIFDTILTTFHQLIWFKMVPSILPNKTM